MRKQKVIIAFLVALLLVLNLWKWLPRLFSASGASGSGLAGLVLDFPSPLGEGEKATGRDAFAFGGSANTALHQRPGHKAQGNKNHPSSALAVSPSAATPLPTLPDGSVLEAKGGYRLMGIAMRKGDSQALIGKSQELFQVNPGDDLGGVYKVGKIKDDEVYLTEKATGNTLRLHLWQDQEGDLH